MKTAVLKGLGLKKQKHQIDLRQADYKINKCGYYVWVKVSIADSICQVSIIKDPKNIVE